MSGFLTLFVVLLFRALNYAIFGRVILSWIDPFGNWLITRIIRDITEPILGPIRRVLPTLGMMDFSPIVAILLLQLLESLVVGALR